MKPEVLNLVSTISAAIAAGAALASIYLASREAGKARKRERYVRWCEEPAIRALQQFHEEVIPPLKETLRSEADQATYRWLGDLIQDSTRRLQEELVQGAVALRDGGLETSVVLACRELEDRLLERIEAYVTRSLESFDTSREVRRWTGRVAEVVARGDPTWE